MEHYFIPILHSFLPWQSGIAEPAVLPTLAGWFISFFTVPTWALWFHLLNY